MNFFLMIIAIVTGIVLVSLIMLGALLLKGRRSAHQGIEWLKQHGTRVIATVTQVKAEQEWQYGSRYNQWNAWEGKYEQERFWQTSYYVIAQWEHPETRQRYTCRINVGSSANAEQFAIGSPLPIIFDPKNPTRWYAELHSATSTVNKPVASAHVWR